MNEIPTTPNPYSQLTRSLKRAGLMILIMVVMAAGLMGYLTYQLQQEMKDQGPQFIEVTPSPSRINLPIPNH